MRNAAQSSGLKDWHGASIGDPVFPTLDPKLDVVFRMLFSSPRNRKILRALLTAVLAPPSPIANIRVLDARKPGAAPLDRGAVLDLELHLDDGTQVHVEMQRRYQGDFIGRGLFYWARSFGGQLARGQPYSELRRTIGIFILDFQLLEGRRLHTTFRVLDTEFHRSLSDLFELHYIELPKVRRRSPVDAADPVLRWAEFFAAKTHSERQRLAMAHPEIQSAYDALEALSQDARARRRAEEREHEIAHWERQFRAEGKAEGRAEGKAEGRAEGKAEGRADGLRVALERACSAKGLRPSLSQRTDLEQASASRLERILEAVLRDADWPPLDE
jgi:predicted transposase/invertase (TIGR01784 family)